MAAELGQCGSCHKRYPKSQLHQLTGEDTQGYFAIGKLVCPSCLRNIRYEAFQLEDEDVEE